VSLFFKAVDKIIKRKITSPTFVKDFSLNNKQLDDLTSLSKRLKDGSKKDLIERDIMYLKYGIEGEKKVHFELKNSFLPMLCLHDIRLEYGDYVAQFDFILICSRFICVLETKKLYGNITINQDGDFIRVIEERKRRTRKEGMYSPVSQNERHVDILKEVLLKENIIKNMPYRSLVVMANPKTIIDKSQCPEHVAKQIYKYDQVIPFLKKLYNELEEEKCLLEKYMHEVADFLIKHDNPISYDYKSKYDIQISDFLPVKSAYGNIGAIVKEQVKESFTVKDGEQLYNALKDYRLATAREEKIPPYYIFNNEQLDALVASQPKTKGELLKIRGFGDKKVEKFGEEILKIMRGNK